MKNEILKVLFCEKVLLADLVILLETLEYHMEHIRGLMECISRNHLRIKLSIDSSYNTPLNYLAM